MGENLLSSSKVYKLRLWLYSAPWRRRRSGIRQRGVGEKNSIMRWWWETSTNARRRWKVLSMFPLCVTLLWLVTGVERKHPGSLQAPPSPALRPSPLILVWFRVRPPASSGTITVCVSQMMSLQAVYLNWPVATHKWVVDVKVTFFFSLEEILKCIHLQQECYFAGLIQFIYTMIITLWRLAVLHVFSGMCDVDFLPISNKLIS